MQVTLPDGTPLELPDGATGADAAAAIGPGLAKAALAVKQDGEVRDLARPLPGRRRWRSSRALRPGRPGPHPPRHGARPGHRGARALPGREDLDRAADRAGLLLRLRVPDRHDRLRGRLPPHRGADARARRRRRAVRARGRDGRPRRSSASAPRTSPTRSSSSRTSSQRTRRVETVSLYRNGPFTDLCRGPHAPTTGRIGAFTLQSVAGAYWRGDASRTMLTRVYGTAFFKQKELDAHLRMLEEARARDHRKLGRELGLFMFSELSPGGALLAAAGHGHLERARRSSGARRTAAAATARSRRRSSTTSSSSSRAGTGTSTATTCTSRTSRTGPWASSP